MPFQHPFLDILFLISVVSIWLMIGYQIILTFAGYRYRQQTHRDHQEILAAGQDLESVTILIPARNEGIVIGATLEAMQQLDYPRDKLEILVINDGSTDETAEVIDAVTQQDQRVRQIRLPESEHGHGKAHALNVGLQAAGSALIAVYDADNRPQPDALKILVPHLASDDKMAAVIGKFRTINRHRNWLTRLINIETLAFQWILQAGRYHLSKVAILPGTNYVIRKTALQSCRGWDENAITEDSELSVRLYQLGYYIKFVPLSITWEQEPEQLSVWLRQRTRWVRGNNYVLRKFAGKTYRLRSKFLLMEFIYLFALYYLFLIAIIISHILFILSAGGLISLNIPGPYTAVWISAFFLFILEIIVVLSYEREDSLFNILLTIAMYFTYCQFWLFVVFKALILDAVGHRKGIWDKTVRYNLNERGKLDAPEL